MAFKLLERLCNQRPMQRFPCLVDLFFVIRGKGGELSCELSAPVGDFVERRREDSLLDYARYPLADNFCYLLFCSHLLVLRDQCLPIFGVGCPTFEEHPPAFPMALAFASASIQRGACALRFEPCLFFSSAQIAIQKPRDFSRGFRLFSSYLRGFSGFSLSSTNHDTS